MLYFETFLMLMLKSISLYKWVISDCFSKLTKILELKITEVIFNWVKSNRKVLNLINVINSFLLNKTRDFYLFFNDKNNFYFLLNCYVLFTSIYYCMELSVLYSLCIAAIYSVCCCLFFFIFFSFFLLIRKCQF